MENLRWILIAAGVAILVLLYFSGRQRRSNSSQNQGMRNAHDLDFDDQGLDSNSGFNDDPLMGGGIGGHRGDQPLSDQYPSFDEIDQDDFARPGNSANRGGNRTAGYEPEYDGFDEFDDLPDLASDAAPSGFATFAQKFEAFSERLSPKRRKLVADSQPDNLDEQTAGDPQFANKIVTLHVVAPQGAMLSGEHLFNVFQNRGYHYGDMNIFHSMHEGTTVFSVAKMIEPGFFDINDIDSFQTPGVTLILQLPGPVPADVSFEVLVSEAHEMARELGATVLDDQHSNLTKQTVQHLREGIYEYMHRQKYFGTVPS